MPPRTPKRIREGFEGGFKEVPDKSDITLNNIIATPDHPKRLTRSTLKALTPKRKEEQSKEEEEEVQQPKGQKKKHEDPESVNPVDRAILISIVLSPGFLFAYGCLLFPALLELVRPIQQPLGFAYLFAWPVLLMVTVGMIVVAVTFSDPSKVKKLNQLDAIIASWYLVNGFFFNSMMDVFAGQFQSWQTMTARYNELEPRYALVGTYDGVTVVLTSCQEILLQTPCGLALFYAYYRASNWRLPVEMVFNMWSVAGVWYFYGSEVVLGFPHIHSPFKNGAFDVQGSLTFDVAYKFWLGFVIFPVLWAVIGVILAVRAAKQISRLADVATKIKGT